MFAVPSPCPDPWVLQDFVAGELDADARDTLDGHLDSCEICRETVVVLASGVRSSTAHPLPATLGRFELGDEIGRGAMGVVVQAHDPRLGRTVALKVLARQDPKALKRLRREARAMATLQHVDVVSLYEVGEDAGQVFLVMPWIRGGNLRRLFDDPRYESGRRQPAQTEHLRRVLLDAARGLSAAHDAGLVHRDFKPENVLLDQHGHALVGDFGIATEPLAATENLVLLDPAEPSLTQTGALIGTPAYMSPEQLRGESATAQSDQFAFCVTAFEAFEGQRPFRGGSLDALRDAMLDSPRFRRTPETWRPVLSRGLAPTPGERYSSMEALLLALATDHAAGLSPRLLSMAAAGVLLGVVLIGFTWLGGSEPRPDKDLRAVARSEFAGWAEEAARDEGLVRWRTDWLAEVDREETNAATLACLRGRAAQVRSLQVQAPEPTLASLPWVVGCGDHSGKRQPVLLQLAALGIRARDGEDVDESLVQLSEQTSSEYVRSNVRLILAELARRAGRSEDAIALLSPVQTFAETAQIELLQLRAWLERAKAEGASARFRRAAESLGHASALAARVDRWGEFEADIANTRGAILYGQGRLDEAEQALERARDLRAARLGETHSLVGAVVTNLANVARARGEFERAFRLHSEAMAIEALHEPADLAAHEHNLGGVRRAEGRLDEARTHYERALQLSGATGRSRGLTLNSLGLVSSAQGDLVEAERYYAEAESVLRQRRHQDVALVLYNRGQLALRRRLPQDAQHLFQSALAEDRQRMGTDAPRVAKDLMGLGDAYRQAGRHRQAEAMWRDALRVAEGPRMQQSLHGAEVQGELTERLLGLAAVRPPIRRVRVERDVGESSEDPTFAPDEPESTPPQPASTARGSAAYGASQAWD